MQMQNAKTNESKRKATGISQRKQILHRDLGLVFYICFVLKQKGTSIFFQMGNYLKVLLSYSSNSFNWHLNKSLLLKAFCTNDACHCMPHFHVFLLFSLIFLNKSTFLCSLKLNTSKTRSRLVQQTVFPIAYQQCTLTLLIFSSLKAIRIIFSYI